MIEISSLKLNDNNPRFIKDARFNQLKQSIEQFPKMMNLRPIVVDGNGVVLGGNMRLRALMDLGYKSIPGEWVKKASELTEEEKRRFVIADNTGFGEWDWEILAKDWDEVELKEWGLELPDEWEQEEPEAQEDGYEVPDEIEVDVKEGDLIEIGRHRLLCGDSTQNICAEKLINGATIDLVLTDPPYEIDFNYFLTKQHVSNAHIFVFNNDRAIVRQLQKSPFSFKKFFIFHHGGTAIPQEGGNEAFLDHILISHEVAGKPAVRFNKGDGLRTVINGEYRRADEHKHQKPHKLLSAIVKAYSQENSIVLDWFAGGGMLFLVCEQLNRTCYGMEIDPKYCQVIINRMHKSFPELEIKINGETYTPKVKTEE